MTSPVVTKRASRKIAATARMMVVIAGSAMGTGCVTVNAPDKPIEINLNIKITQEVVYRFDGDAKKLIDDNPGIF